MSTTKEAPGKGAEVKSLTGGPQKLYFVGLVEEAPFDAINVPTCVIPDSQGGNIRGTAPSVPKRSARLAPDGKGGLVHIEGGKVGDHVKLYPVEYEAFVKYCDTHVFRKTSTYRVRQPDNSEVEMWRAEIEAVEAGPSAIRILGEEQSIQSELLSKYVWIVPAQANIDGTPVEMGRQLTIAEARKEKEAQAAAAAPKQENGAKPPGGK